MATTSAFGGCCIEDPAMGKHELSVRVQAACPRPPVGDGASRARLLAAIAALPIICHRHAAAGSHGPRSAGSSPGAYSP